MARFFLIFLFSWLQALSQDAHDSGMPYPPTSAIAPWQIRTCKPYQPHTLHEYINGGAELFLEYGVEQAASLEYIHGEQGLVVDIYAMQTPEAAFGIYSANRDLRHPALAIGAEATQFDYHLIFWQDRFYVMILADLTDSLTRRTMHHFAGLISHQIKRQSPPPLLLQSLPTTGLQRRSVIFIKGTQALNRQFYLGDENPLRPGLCGAVSGIYHIDDTEGALLVLQYAHDDSATQRAEALQAHLLKVLNVHPGGKGYFQDNRQRYYAWRRQGPQVWLVYKADSRALCDALLARMP